MTVRRFGLAGVLVGLLGTALIGLPLAASHASAPQAGHRLPRAPDTFSSSVTSLKIRPMAIFSTGDGTGVLTGATTSSSIDWSSWTATTALGSGYDQINNCRPDCAGGRFTAYPVRLEIRRPATLHGALVFTRLTIFYAAKRPAGASAHYTFTDLYSRGWGFGPPAAEGYCTHTEGEPEAAGCANIDALP